MNTGIVSKPSMQPGEKSEIKSITVADVLAVFRGAKTVAECERFVAYLPPTCFECDSPMARVGGRWICCVCGEENSGSD
jgi:hypothetical protein